MSVVKVCLQCNKEFTVALYRQNLAKYCSSSCHNDSRRNKPNLSLKGRKFPNRRNSGQFGARPSNYWKGKQRIDMLGKDNMYYRMSKEQRLQKHTNHSETMKGRTNPEHSEYMKQFYFEHPEKHPNRIMANLHKTGKGYISKGQLKLYLEIKKIHSEAELNYPVKTSTGNLYFADIALPSLKLIIEYDGEYWHRDQEKDTIRDFNMQADGWKIYRIKESEYKQRPMFLSNALRDITYGESIVSITGGRTS